MKSYLKKRYLFLPIVLGGVGYLAYLLVHWLYPEIRAKQAMQSVRVDSSGLLTVNAETPDGFSRRRVAKYWKISKARDRDDDNTSDPVTSVFYNVNTYTDGVSSQRIADLYHELCSDLRSNSALPVASYRETDRVGYHSISTLVQARNGYIEVRAHMGNDNDGVTITVSPGRYDDERATKLNDQRLPKGLLRGSAH